MCDEVVYVVALEVMEDGYGHGAVREARQGRDGPLRRVAAAQGHLVAALNPRLLEQQMQFGYLACYVAVLERHAVKVGQCQFFPVLTYRVLYVFVEMFAGFHS